MARPKLPGRPHERRPRYRDVAGARLDGLREMAAAGPRVRGLRPPPRRDRHRIRLTGRLLRSKFRMACDACVMANDAPKRPSRAELQGALGRAISSVLREDLAIVFVGINPGLASGATGHHFAGPGNRFWKALYGAGFTDRVLGWHEDHRLLEYDLGVTNLVNAATARASDLSLAEIRDGASDLISRLRPLRSKMIAFLGIGTFAQAFGRGRVTGRVAEPIAGAEAWVLPNPSGLNANHQLPELIQRFEQVRLAAGLPDRRRGAR